jgi:hypothetical protein
MIWSLLFSCTDPLNYTPLFDGPSHISIATPEMIDLYTDPVGFVSNARSGKIVPIDLIHMGPLSDQSAAPFLRGRGIATGSQRQLQKNMVYQNEVGHVRLLIHDPFHQKLVDIPYLQDSTTPSSPQSSQVVFTDHDSSGDSAFLSEMTLSIGHTTTEDWTLTFDGISWLVEGSRSGPQPDADFEEIYTSSNNEISLEITGTASAGDQLSFSTDTGITELDIGGIPLSFASLGDQIIVSVWDPDTQLGGITVFSLSTKQQIAHYPAPPDTQPWLISILDDDTLFISDAYNPTIYRFSFDDDWIPISTEDIVQDMHILNNDDSSKLYVGGVYSISRYDIDEQNWDDLNLLDPFSNSIRLFNPFQQFSSNSLYTSLPTRQNAQEREDDLILLSLASGEIMLLEGESGCLSTTSEGPSLADSDYVGSSAVSFYDEGVASTPSLTTDLYSSEQISLNPCGGILKDETWSITFDGIQGDWEVKGSISGTQENRAHPHERYLTDRGELSFTITDGALQATDGDYFRFESRSNLLLFSSITNNQGQLEALEHPMAGVFYQNNEIPYAAIPLQGSDVVIRIDIEDWLITGIWN